MAGIICLVSRRDSSIGAMRGEFAASELAYHVGSELLELKTMSWIALSDLIQLSRTN